MKWFEQTTKPDAINAVAAKSGIVGSTLNRQLRAGSLSPESVVLIARAYNADVIEALMISGLITPADLGTRGMHATLAEVSDRALVDEVWNRIQRGSLDENGEPRSVDIDIATDVVVIE